MYFSTMYDYQSSSSSSTSGAATPVDGVSPVLVVFPRHGPLSGGLVSSGSSSFSLDKHRSLRLSFPKSHEAVGARTYKLSLDSAKAKPLPAAPCLPSENSPLGAFTPTSTSAAKKLRSLVSKNGHVRYTSLPNKSEMTSPAKHESKQGNGWSYDDNSDNDNDDSEPEAFWPRRNDPTSRVVPSITRTSAPPVTVPDSRAVHSHARPSRLRSHSAVPASLDIKRPIHVRSQTEPGPSALPRKNVVDVHPQSRPTRTFLEPKHKIRADSLPSAPKYATGKEITSLNPSLAAIEQASRLRARCVCSVCGKAGVDYPRCPRCTTTWCSRQCRVSEKAAGSARHKCAGKPSGGKAVASAAAQ